jgi:hypothetical protein
MIYLILFVVILGTILFKLFDMINVQFKSSIKQQDNLIIPITKIPTKTQLTEIYKDITIEPYGCFSSLDEKFFLKQMNPYNNKNIFDSGIIISEDKRTDDMRELIQQVINNGFDQYGYSMLHKYDNDPDGYSKNMNIKEIAVLGKLAGYNYLSVYKLDENTRGKIYLTYSPPMDKQLGYNTTKEEYTRNLTQSENTYTLTPKLNNYTNEQEKAPGKELSCGYPCLPYNKPMTFVEKGITKQYMCGSVGYPDIKTPPRFAVYQIIEKS